MAEQHRAVHPHTSAPHHAPQAHTVSLFSQGATTTQHQPDEGPQPHNTNPTSSSNLAQLNLYLFQLCPIDRSAGRVSPLTWVPLAPYLPPSVESIHSPAIQIDIKQEYWLATWVSYLPPCLPPGYHTFPPVPAQTAEPYRAVACPALPANYTGRSERGSRPTPPPFTHWPTSALSTTFSCCPGREAVGGWQGGEASREGGKEGHAQHD